MSKLNKPLHEYKRDFTQEELDEGSRHLSEGKSINECAKLMGLHWNRAKTLYGKVEVMREANRLRETELIPNALRDMIGLLEGIHSTMVQLEQRTTEVEAQNRKLCKAVGYQAIRDRQQREKISRQKAEMSKLRATIRRAGLIPPTLED